MKTQEGVAPAPAGTCTWSLALARLSACLALVGVCRFLALASQQARAQDVLCLAGSPTVLIIVPFLAMLCYPTGILHGAVKKSSTSSIVAGSTITPSQQQPGDQQETPQQTQSLLQRQESIGQGKPVRGLLRRLARRVSNGRRAAMDAIRRQYHERTGIEPPFARRSPSFSSARSCASGASSRSSVDVSLTGSSGTGPSTSSGVSGLGPFRAAGALAMGVRALLRRGSGGDARWRPSIPRICSGQNLQDFDGGHGSVSSRDAQGAELSFPHNGHDAVSCLANDVTGPEVEGVKQVVTETHLLQFGADLQEASAQLALAQRGAPPPYGPAPGSVFGPVNNHEGWARGWEKVVEDHTDRVHYWVWRRQVREGMNAHKSRIVYEDVSPADVVNFMYEWRNRATWESGAEMRPLAPPGNANLSLDSLEQLTAGGSSFMYASQGYGAFMKTRDYVYARRVWYKPDDGGAYVISRACQHPDMPPQPGAVRVDDYVQGDVIRATRGICRPDRPAVEVITNYFENNRAPASLVNSIVAKKCWPRVLKVEKALRAHVAGETPRPPARRLPAAMAHGCTPGAGVCTPPPSLCATPTAAGSRSAAAAAMGFLAGGRVSGPSSQGPESVSSVSSRQSQPQPPHCLPPLPPPLGAGRSRPSTTGASAPVSSSPLPSQPPAPAVRRSSRLPSSKERGVAAERRTLLQQMVQHAWALGLALVQGPLLLVRPAGTAFLACHRLLQSVAASICAAAHVAGPSRVVRAGQLLVASSAQAVQRVAQQLHSRLAGVAGGPASSRGPKGGSVSKPIASYPIAPKSLRGRTKRAWQKVANLVLKISTLPLMHAALTSSARDSGHSAVDKDAPPAGRRFGSGAKGSSSNSRSGSTSGSQASSSLTSDITGRAARPEPAIVLPTVNRARITLAAAAPGSVRLLRVHSQKQQQQQQQQRRQAWEEWSVLYD